VKADRDWISQSSTADTQDNRTKTYRWRLIAQSVAGRRAAVRDGTWFEAERCRYFNLRADSLVRPRDQTVLRRALLSTPAATHHAEALRMALKTTLDVEACVQVTVARLAALAGITVRMARNTLREDRTLALEIRSARHRRFNASHRDARLRVQ
jgi:hypothetical protein